MLDIKHPIQPAGRRSFTLVELIIVMTVLAMLSTFLLRSLQVVRESAKATKTAALIAKLNKVIMAQWESYLTRRVPVDVATLAQTSWGNTSPAYMARARVNALRDLMRMEMPDRWTDVCSNPNSPSLAATPQLVLPAPPACTYRYLYLYYTAFTTPGVNKNLLQLHASEKCLYMIVMNDPEGAASFREDESADLDGDGLRMFIDGWGHPIKFLRWPAGFLPDQGGRAPATAVYKSGDKRWNADTDLQTVARIQDSAGSGTGKSSTGVNTSTPFFAPDPFNPMNVVASWGPSGGGITYNYALYPLIYSAGPDGHFDINSGWNGSTPYAYRYTRGGYLCPYTWDGNHYVVGTPLNEDDSTSPPRHLDNIHNHRLETR